MELKINFNLIFIFKNKNKYSKMMKNISCLHELDGLKLLTK